MVLALAIYTSLSAGIPAALMASLAGIAGVAIGGVLGIFLVVVGKRYGVKHLNLVYAVLILFAAGFAIWLRDADMPETVEQCAARMSPSPNLIAILNCAASRWWLFIKACAGGGALVGFMTSVLTGAEAMPPAKKSLTKPMKG